MYFYLFQQVLSKLLICGGKNTSGETDNCEVINLDSSSATTCKNPPNLPPAVYGAIGGLGHREKPIICGGNQNNGFSKSCYTFENNEWISSPNMNSVRIYAAAAQLQNGSLFVTGGFNGEGQTNSVEMLAEEEWESKIVNVR